MTTKIKPIIVVQGAQWGSEGKGMVTGALAVEREADVVVRTGTVNAGHTVYYQPVMGNMLDKKFGAPMPYKMQQLPVSWATQPSALMVIGVGAYIHPPTLIREMRLIQSATGKIPDVVIDHNAGIHLDDHTGKATIANRHHSIGATGKGCSEAVMGKIRDRGTGAITLFKQWAKGPGSGSDPILTNNVHFDDVSAMLNANYRGGKQIIIEGTQGSHLDLHLGPYPYTTHKQSQAAQWILEAGLGLGLEYEIILVARTFPIRVAGNSGPMQNETSWPEIVREMNGKLRLVGRPELVEDHYIVEWERAVSDAGSKYGMTRHEAINQHLITGARRQTLREGLSEVNKDAFATLSGRCQRELRKVFEFTTVTNKLRRVARWNAGVVLKAMEWNGFRQHRDRLVLSFINYVDPTVWGMTDINQFRDIGYAWTELQYKPDYITTGPETKHFIKTSHP